MGTSILGPTLTLFDNLLHSLFGLVCCLGFRAKQGHFPGNPVLPGVEMLRLLLESAQGLNPERIQSPLNVLEVTGARFHSIVSPPAVVEVHVQLLEKLSGDGLVFRGDLYQAQTLDDNTSSGQCICSVQSISAQYT